MLTPQAEIAEASARDDLRTDDVLARGFARSRAGEVTDALADLDEARRHDGDRLDDLDRATLLATIVDCRLARGDLSEAQAAGEELGSLLDAPGPAGATAHFGRGELAVATGVPEAAYGHFTRAGLLLAAGEDDPYLLPWRAAAALTEVRLGHRSEAVVLASEHLALAREAGSPYAVALGLRTVATVGVHVDRAATLREARAALFVTPAARLAAQLDTDLAGLLLLSGGSEPQQEALVLLRSAEEYAGREQLWPLQGRVRRLLDRMGEPARPLLGEALAALTAAERKVARLAADGMTNREIAGQLVVTVKAVEWHLSHVYRKLGIRSRAALTDSLGVALEPSA